MMYNPNPRPIEQYLLFRYIYIALLIYYILFTKLDNYLMLIDKSEFKVDLTRCCENN